MVCVECGEAATVTLREAGVVTGLCQACLARLDRRMTGFLGRFSRPRLAAEKCPFCGTTEQEFSEGRLAGCGLCYEAFAESLARMGH